MITEEMLLLWRNKLNDIAASVPNYVGSLAQKHNEISQSLLEYAAFRENEKAQNEEDEEPQTIINIIGGSR